MIQFLNYIHFFLTICEVLQGAVMILSVVIVALFGIYESIGFNIIWDQTMNSSQFAVSKYQILTLCLNLNIIEDVFCWNLNLEFGDNNNI